MDYHYDEKPDLPPGSLILSTTPLKTQEDCKRKHYLQYVLDLPELRKTSFTIGSVVHACNERWLLSPGDIVPHPSQAPDQPVTEFGAYAPGSVLFGQVPGAKINLFPPGWTKIKERDGTWEELKTEADIQLARDLVNKGLEVGMLTRYPDGRVERKFWLKVLSNLELRAAGFVTEAEVWVTSLIDFSSVKHGILEDHKTSAKAEYLLNSAELQENSQMLLYAYVLFLWMEDAGNGSDTIRAAHNQYIKERAPKTGNVSVRKTQTTISKKQAFTYFAKLKKQALEMFRLRLEMPEYRQVPMTESMCGKYGSCAYSNICLGIQSPTQYKEEMTQRLQGGVFKPFETNPTPTMTQAPLSFGGPPPQAPLPSGGYAPLPMQAPAPMQPGGQPQQQWPQQSAPPQQQWPQQPQQAPPPQQWQPQAPPPSNLPNVQSARNQVPWASRTCPYCQGLGLQNDGTNCPMCIQLLQDTRLHPAHFRFGFDPSGQWRCEPNTPPPAAAPQAPQIQPIAAPPGVPATGPAPIAQQWQEVEPPDAAGAKPEGVAKGRRGRKPGSKNAPKADQVQVELQPIAVEAAAPAQPVTQTQPPNAATDWLRAQLNALLTVEAGRPSRAGMILLIDCAPQTVRSGPRPTALSAILIPLRAEFARLHGKDYYDAESFPRRDWMARFASNIAEVFADGIVVCPSPQADYENGPLINALMGHAAYCFRGVK
jgi:hypothetical protein